MTSLEISRIMVVVVISAIIDLFVCFIINDRRKEKKLLAKEVLREHKINENVRKVVERIARRLESGDCGEQTRYEG